MFNGSEGDSSYRPESSSAQCSTLAAKAYSTPVEDSAHVCLCNMAVGQNYVPQMEPW